MITITPSKLQDLHELGKLIDHSAFELEREERVLQKLFKQLY